MYYIVNIPKEYIYKKTIQSNSGMDIKEWEVKQQQYDGTVSTVVCFFRGFSRVNVLQNHSVGRCLSTLDRLEEQKYLHVEGN